ncbi:MAG: SusC/RagA family TonB-linked outer membrane protein, partial [Tannerella sp.]|nr:SusC/RagA family TonB-linked outer membrane protein [Tannerella sp.]
MNAQVTQGITLTGTIVDESGESMPGVSVVIKGTTTSVLTDIDGRYTITVPQKDVTLVFSFVGYKKQELRVGDRKILDVTLIQDNRILDEVVVVGYGVQRKVTLTGAVAAIKGEDMIVTKNENAQNMLTGKVPGLRVTQRTAEPGNFQMNFDIRGMGSPLIVIDGIPRDMGDFQRIDANDIDNISILKDASAAIYGVRAANGVVLITTKKGSKHDGKPKLTYSGSYTFQMPSGMPSNISALDFTTLRNEKSLNSVGNPTRLFTEEMIEEYRNGTRPTTDWYSLIFADWSPQTTHNLSATGGNDRTQYYVGLGYQYQQGFFKSNDLTYSRYNVRANITTKITNQLTFDINLSGTIDERSQPYNGSMMVVRNYWRTGAHVPAYADDEETMLY